MRSVRPRARLPTRATIKRYRPSPTSIQRLRETDAGDRGIAPHATTYAPSTAVEGARGVRSIPLRRRKHMPKWQVSLTRDASQDAEVVIEAETAEEAKQFFLHAMGRQVSCSRAGTW